MARQPPHHAFGVLAEPRAGRGDENAGPAPGRVGAARGGEAAQHVYTLRFVANFPRRFIHARNPRSPTGIRYGSGAGAALPSRREEM
jgi:hypothetical protein